MNQHLSEIGVDAPISLFVGFGQGAASDGAADACMVKFGIQGPQAGFDIAETFSVGELSEGHTKKLIEAGKCSHSVIALISLNTFVEFVSWQELH